MLLLHVVEALPPLPPMVPGGPVLVDYLQGLETDAQERLRRVVPAGAGDWCEPEVCVVRASPGARSCARPRNATRA